VVIVIFVMYGIAQWYIWSERNQPLKLGVSFIPDYAQSLGVDPQANLDGLLNIGVKHLRLVSYWSDGEPAQGQYDFSQLDWEFQKAEAKGAKITLSVGLRQPRWPECHMPDWASKEDKSAWQPQLEKYVAAVVNRYKNSPALDSYQIENEYFLKGFGICETIPGSMDRNRLVSEYNLVKNLDPNHKLIVNRSNNSLGWPVGQPQPDEFGISIYKRVWDATLTHRYLEYPQPAWFYGTVAGWQKMMTGKDMIIHELQAEAWAPDNKSIQDISLAEQNKSLNAKRFEDRFGYAKATGMKEVYMWGAEYWYYRMVVLHDPSLWNVAKQQFQDAN
ncbi:MAG: beta-galactosidase, partial [Candidatus Saccharimonadales bacterium]